MPSVMQRIGTPNERHNKDVKYRAKLENVDPTLTQYNEVLREKSVEAIYAEHLQPAFDAFNERQKRKDRRLDVKWGVSTALELQRAMDEKARASKNEIDQKGRPPIREIVWQFGNPQQGYGCAGQTVESRQKAKLMLLECQAEAERRYPQLAWGDLVFHADEVSQDAEDEEHGSLHLHSEFVPLCFQNKQGPDVQVAMERCLKEMGFATFQEWKHDLDSIMEEVLERHGLERTFMDNHEKHQESTDFHRQQRVKRQTKELEAERARAAEQAKELQAQLGVAQAKLDSITREADAQAQRAYDASVRARDAEERERAANFRADVIDGENEALVTALTAQQELYDRNDAVIQDQEEALGLIRTVEEYQDEALDLIDTIDTAEALVVQEMPAAAKLFKLSAADSFIRKMETLFEKLRKYVEVGIQRLRIYERTHDVSEPLSEPVQKRASALNDMIAGAFARTEAAPNKGQTKEKDEPSR